MLKNSAGKGVCLANPNNSVSDDGITGGLHLFFAMRSVRHSSTFQPATFFAWLFMNQYFLAKDSRSGLRARHRCEGQSGLVSILFRRPGADTLRVLSRGLVRPAVVRSLIAVVP